MKKDALNEKLQQSVQIELTKLAKYKDIIDQYELLIKEGKELTLVKRVEYEKMIADLKLAKERTTEVYNIFLE